MPAPRNYPEELRERAIRMAVDLQRDPIDQDRRVPPGRVILAHRAAQPGLAHPQALTAASELVGLRDGDRVGNATHRRRLKQARAHRCLKHHIASARYANRRRPQDRSPSRKNRQSRLSAPGRGGEVSLVVPGLAV